MPNIINQDNNEVKLLIDERRNRKKEYWFMLRRSKLYFWKKVAKKIKEEFKAKAKKA